MSDVPADAAEEWVRTWTASVSQRAAAAQLLSDQVARLNITASDADHMIAVTVNGSGNMINLRLSDKAAGLTMEDLADRILRTMRKAQAAMVDRVAAIAEQTVGRDSETARAVVSSFASRFPAESLDEGDDKSGGRFHDR